MRALDHLRAISLDELRDSVALQVRMERKYVLTVEQVAILVERLGDTHACLDVAGLRAFRYHTTYYDTPELLTYHEHLQGRRFRFKCRRRHYVDSDVANLELKLKRADGSTAKRALPCEPAGAFDVAERRFLVEQIAAEQRREIDPDAFAPTLSVHALRVTLAAPQLGERVTFDVSVRMGAWELADGLTIAETKSSMGHGETDRTLQTIGARPLRASKYCAGIALSGAGRRPNRMLPFVRCFTTSPDALHAPA